MYAEVNAMFGDLIKVTPSSKVVGDMAIFMVTNHLTTHDVMERGHEISFPDSVVNFFKGDLGQPLGGFPKDLQKIILKNVVPFTNRPNEHLKPVNFTEEFSSFKRKFQKGFTRTIELEDFLSYMLYPKVFEQAHENYKKYGNISLIPTKNFFYGMKLREEILIELEPGKTVIIKLLSISIPNEDGIRTIFFKVNGENRSVDILDKSLHIIKEENVKTDLANPLEIGAPLQGSLYKIFVKEGQEVKKNEPLFVIEAMKMENTVAATRNGVVAIITLKAGSMVTKDDLVLTLV
jgi:pyruvate carboxylase